MTKYYVYELVNLMGGIEYVGKTTNPKYRFYQHVKRTLGRGQGLFHKRLDISMHIVSIHETNKEALQSEYDLQVHWGFTPDKLKFGRIGLQNKTAKLREEEIIQIKKLLQLKIPRWKIAEKFNISKTTITHIKQNKVWKHVNV
jgi:predicted GIY-YIG superfamily endonuclease